MDAGVEAEFLMLLEQFSESNIGEEDVWECFERNDFDFFLTLQELTKTNFIISNKIPYDGDFIANSEISTQLKEEIKNYQIEIPTRDSKLRLKVDKTKNSTIEIENYTNYKNLSTELNIAFVRAKNSSVKQLKRNVDFHSFNKQGTIQVVVRELCDLKPSMNYSLKFVTGKGMHSKKQKEGSLVSDVVSEVIESILKIKPEPCATNEGSLEVDIDNYQPPKND